MAKCNQLTALSFIGFIKQIKHTDIYESADMTNTNDSCKITTAQLFTDTMLSK